MASDLRALTLHRVWAGMVALGWKPYEFRDSRPLACIGQRVAIHAGRKVGDSDAAIALVDRQRAALVSMSSAYGIVWRAAEAAPAGHIIATAVVGLPIDLVADPYEDAEPGASHEPCVPCRRQEAARKHRPPGYEGTRYAIPLLDVWRLREPVPCRGSVTLGWRVPDDVAAKVRKREVVRG